jgi:allene oxide cyclase
MRKLVALVAVAGALVALAVVGAGAFASPSAKKAAHGWARAGAGSAAIAKAAAAAPDGAEHIVLIAKEVRSAGVDAPPAGDSPGDTFFFEEVLWNQGRTMRVGRDAAHCTLGIRTIECGGTLLLAGRGKINVHGVLFGERDSVIPVTGGTGQFAHVDGVFVVTDINDTTARYDLFIER